MPISGMLTLTKSLIYMELGGSYEFRKILRKSPEKLIENGGHFI